MMGFKLEELGSSEAESENLALVGVECDFNPRVTPRSSFGSRGRLYAQSADWQAFQYTRHQDSFGGTHSQADFMPKEADCPAKIGITSTVTSNSGPSRQN